MCDATGKDLSLQGSFNKPQLMFCVAKESSRVIDYSLNQNQQPPSLQTNKQNVNWNRNHQNEHCEHRVKFETGKYFVGILV